MKSRLVLLPFAVCLLFTGMIFASEDDVVATGRGLTIDRATLEKSAQEDLHQLDLDRKRVEAELEKRRYQILSGKLKELVGQQLLKLEAEKRQMTVQQLLVEIGSNAPQPTDEEVEKVYEANKSRLQGPKEQVLPHIRKYVQDQKARDALAKYVDGLTKEYGVEINLQPIRFEVASAGSPSMGPADAPVTIVEFSDFQCPYCARAHSTLEKVVENYAPKVRLVFRQFPLIKIHHDAERAAEAALCANQQGKFWEMHDAMFADQSKLSAEGLKETAKTLGLDEAQFNACLDSNEFKDEISADSEAGATVGVSGTPAFFINGRPLNGAVSYDVVAKIVDEELAKTAGSH